MALFNRYTLRTPESVELEFTLAGIGNRLYALIIDYLVLGVGLITLMLLWALIWFNLRVWLEDLSGLGLWLFAVQLLLIFALYVGYFVFFETLWQGQTPGKRWLKIRVIRDDGRPVGLAQTTLRALLRPIDDWLYIGMFFIIFGRQEKRIGDLLAGTLVIRESSPQGKAQNNGLQNLAQAQPLATQLTSQSQLERLSPDHMAIVREYLRNRGEMLAPARERVARQLQAQVQEIIQFSEFSVAINAELFLEAVYLAHQELN